tara:strand:+ start:438 stop:689 length:252 start_codon:yes stop_codon:yes gene_type:complete
MKKEELKEIIKEVIGDVIKESQLNFMHELTPGEYEINYRYEEGREKYEDTITKSITDEDIANNTNISIDNFMGGKVRSIKKVG